MSKEFHFDVKSKPYDHQIDAFHSAYGKEFHALFMEQGTGKSKVSIDIASNLFKEGKIEAVMLIAPNGVHTQWIQEQLPEHSSVYTTSWVWSTNKSKAYIKTRNQWMRTKHSDKLKWFAVNVEAFSSSNHIKFFSGFVKYHNTLIIVDECTRIKNPEANRTFNIVYNLAKVIKNGRRVVDVRPYSDYRLILTGTMITNSPYDLWSMFEFLKHNYFGINYYAFKARYGIEVRDTHPGTGRTFMRKIRPDEIESIRRYLERGKSVETVAAIMAVSESSVEYIKNHKDISLPYKRLDELKASIQPDSFIIRKEDCLDLPPKVYSRIEVEMKGDLKRIYNELKEEYMTEYMDKELTVSNKMVLVSRLQQVTGGFFPYNNEEDKPKLYPIGKKNPKLEALKADLEETGNEQIIIWARFVGELKRIHQELTKSFPDKNIELYYGGVLKYRRDKIRKSFQEGTVNILVANPKTAGIGLNLQNAHLQYFFSNSFSLEDRLQAEDRSHRIGQTHSVLYKDIIMLDTVDEVVFHVLKAKRNLLDFFRTKDLMEILHAR